MKKLVDETTDELTRSLLIAGIEHRPPTGNKAQLLVALGAGSAVGLFSAKAFGWFGTSAGKLTVVSMAIGVAGAVYSAAPLIQADGTSAPAALEERRESTQASSVVAPLLPAPDTAPVREASAAAAPLQETGPAPAAASAEAAPPVVKAKVESRKSRARIAGAEHNSGPLPAVEKTPPAVGASAQPEQAPEAEKTRERLRLDTEVSLVDDMHLAVRQKDHEALARYVEAYRLQFPDGQLQAEVAKFAARLERSSPR